MRSISLVIFVAFPCQLYAPQVHGDELRPNLPAEVRLKSGLDRARLCLEMFSRNHGWKIPEVNMCSLNFVYMFYMFLHDLEILAESSSTIPAKWPQFGPLCAWLSCHGGETALLLLRGSGAPGSRCGIAGHCNGVIHFTSTSGVPSGKHTKNYGKSPFLMGRSTINGHFQ